MDLSNRGFAQVGAMLVGVVYVAAGVIGFVVTGFGGLVQNGNDTFLSFDINPFHDIVHLVIGSYLLIVAQFGRNVTEGALIGGGLVYLLAAFLGFTNHLQIISINAPLATDNFLHLVSGSAALLIGLASVSANAAAERRGEPLEQR